MAFACNNTLTEAGGGNPSLDYSENDSGIVFSLWRGLLCFAGLLHAQKCCITQEEKAIY